MTSARGQLTTPESVKTALFAGNATVTIVSKKTGARFTVKITASKPQAGRDQVHFVKLLTGPSNESDFDYVGLLDARGVRLTSRSRLTPHSVPVKALTWLTQHVEHGSLPEGVEVWHETGRRPSRRSRARGPSSSGARTRAVAGPRRVAAVGGSTSSRSTGRSTTRSRTSSPAGRA